MPIPLPNLDDRKFSDLMAEMRALIPRYASGWTDHNVSDPGITLVELFAWLTEALIYRLNRVPQASEVRFLELLGATFQSAQPATAILTVTADGLTGRLPVPRRTPLVVKSPSGSELLAFETVYDRELAPEQPSGLVEARQVALVQGERLGSSTGKPHQVFPVAQRYLVLDPQGPFAIVPEVRVDGELWTFKPNLLDSGETDIHYTVEPYFNAVRFGDGVLGKVPAEGSEITISYRYTRGARGSLPEDTVFALDTQSSDLSLGLRAAVDSGLTLLVVAEYGASGGANPTSLEEAQQQAVGALKTRWRAVSADDFERLVLGEEELEIARARCLPERDLTAADPDKDRPGHVSVIIVPDEKRVRKPVPSQERVDDVYDFLDKRRLVTCRHHVVGPSYTDICVAAEVARVSQTPPTEVVTNITTNLEGFFGVFEGGPEAEGEGWPFGRDVYASEVYQVIEGTEGVDHVESLTLYVRDETSGDWAEAGDEVEVAANSLVCFVAKSVDTGFPGKIDVRVGR
ncbi:MAG: baseplate J/gp47 family protein [Anaerolineae bacterium]|nr:baseplate J/gp47 family protein [Anaerolineae bacterium]